MLFWGMCFVSALGEMVLAGAFSSWWDLLSCFLAFFLLLFLAFFFWLSLWVSLLLLFSSFFAFSSWWDLHSTYIYMSVFFLPFFAFFCFGPSPFGKIYEFFLAPSKTYSRYWVLNKSDVPALPVLMSIGRTFRWISTLEKIVFELLCSSDTTREPWLLVLWSLRS